MGRKRDGGSEDALEPVAAIAEFATIFPVKEAPAPILSDPIRGAMRSWLTELGAANELEAVGLKPRRSVLLIGPPGCGKTTLAHHLSARLGLPMVLVDMAALTSQWVGGTGQNIVRLFSALRKQTDRMVLFLDEFDGMAQARTSARQGADKERNNIVVALLQHFDRYEGTLFAATNRGDDIDPAVWRRFGMQITIDLPNLDCRFAIIKQYLAPLVWDDGAIDVLCRLTNGATPALLRQLMESIKRDIVLAPRINMDITARAVFERALTTIMPAAEATKPMLWDGGHYLDEVAALPWPPTLP